MANATPSFLGKANNSGDDNALFLKFLRKYATYEKNARHSNRYRYNEYWLL